MAMESLRGEMVFGNLAGNAVAVLAPSGWETTVSKQIVARRMGFSS